MSTASESKGNASSSVAVAHSFSIQSSLPLPPGPPRLELSENVAESWKKWKQRWDSFEIASRLVDQENKYRVATFITCIGDDAIEIYNALPFEQEEDKQTTSKVLELMERHCVGQTNVIYERYCFNNRNQESGESFDCYLTALKVLAKTCNFGALTDELIRDRIVCGIRDVSTRKKLLQEAKLSMRRCLDVCRSAETTETQVKAMSGKDDDSSYLTTFGTPFGRYRWLKMPFGISPAPEYFQHRLDQAIEGLPGVRTVADDILICGEGNTMEDAVQDHDKKLLALLDRCRKNGLKINKDKVKLKMTEIPYVGHLLTQGGLKPDPSKVEAVRKMTRPTDVKGLQRLIGLVNYLTRFLDKLADICEPLRQLTRKDTEWQWNEVHEIAFAKIKEAITGAPVLIEILRSLGRNDPTM